MYFPQVEKQLQLPPIKNLALSVATSLGPASIIFKLQMYFPLVEIILPTYCGGDIWSFSTHRFLHGKNAYIYRNLSVAAQCILSSSVITELEVERKRSNYTVYSNCRSYQHGLQN